MRNRRNVGVAGIKKKQAAAAANADVATTMKASTAAHASQAITALTTAIEAFAQTHKEEIKTDPAFRSQFLKMCTPLGIDPLSSENGFWGKALGIGDFYYELAIKASEVCVASKNRNGGVIALSEVSEWCVVRRAKRASKTTLVVTNSLRLLQLRGILERRENAKFNIKNNNNLLQKKKKKTVKISEADVETAIKKMEILGTSFKVSERSERAF